MRSLCEDHAKQSEDDAATIQNLREDHATTNANAANTCTHYAATLQNNAKTIRKTKTFRENQKTIHKSFF